MVVAAESSDGVSVRIVARGNFSLDAGGLLNLLLALAAVTLGLAALLAWQGFWPILLIALGVFGGVLVYNVVTVIIG